MTRNLARACCVAALLVLVASSARGQGRAAELDLLLKAFFEAADPPARQPAIAAIRAAAPDPLVLERGLSQGRSYPTDVRPGWQVFAHTGSDGKVRPYHVYAPRGYDRTRKHPVFVWLHGRVDRPDLMSGAELAQLLEGQHDADQYGWLVVIPLGQRGATWRDRVGMGNVLAQTRGRQAAVQRGRGPGLSRRHL